MAISFGCGCGRRFTVDDALAGKRTRCPSCKEALTVPEAPPPAEPDYEVVEDDYEVVEDDAPAADYAVVAADEPEPAPAKKTPKRDPDKLRYFTAGTDGSSFGTPRLFRFYPDGDAILMIHAGPFNWRLVAQQAGENGPGPNLGHLGAQHGLVGVGIGMIGAAVMAMGDRADAKEQERRGDELDEMTPYLLRAEAETNDKSLRLTDDDVTDVTFEPPSTSMWANKQIEPLVAGRLRFTHAPTGKWKMVFTSRKDAKAALKAFRKLVGPDNVEGTYRDE